MQKIIDTQTADDPNVFGEIIREFSFKEAYGCYSCFDLLDEFTQVPEGYDIQGRLQMAMGIHKTQDVDNLCYSPDELRNSASYFSNGTIHIGWYWDVDGTLAIIEGTRCAVNTDFKKAYGWQWYDCTPFSAGMSAASESAAKHS